MRAHERHAPPKEEGAVQEGTEEKAQEKEAAVPKGLIELAVGWLEFRNGGVFEEWGGGEDPVARYLVSKMQYQNVDRLKHPQVEVHADLTQYSSSADSIL